MIPHKELFCKNDKKIKSIVSFTKNSCMIYSEILLADSGFGVWLYLIIFAVLLLISSYKFRKRFQPKYLFEFRQEKNHDSKETEEILKVAEQNLRFLKAENDTLYGGWMFSRDGFLIGTNDENFSAIDKIHASNDAVNFSPSLYRIHLSNDKNWILYKYAGIHTNDPLAFLQKNDLDYNDVFLATLLNKRIKWEKISKENLINNNQYLILKLSTDAEILKGFPLISESGQLLGLVSQTGSKEDYHQIAVSPMENILKTLKINVISESK
ncbi:MAG: hypothetical protein EA412_02275 [Chitinophagaceae bacterium]|nr:MAG: hypothetical protein EA412_02275 [Chitinophagaceae bacterium]